MEVLASAAPNLYPVHVHVDCYQSQNCRGVRLLNRQHVQTIRSTEKYISEGNSPSALKYADLLAMDCTSQFATYRDAAIDSCISDLLAHDDFLNLPRVQVNVDVSTQVLEFSTDAGIIEVLLSRAVSQLEGLASSAPDQLYLEEGVVTLVLLPDFSLAPLKDVTKRTQFLMQSSPEKPSLLAQLKAIQPSPARKLILDESMEGEDDVEEEERRPTWKVITTAKLSEISSVSLIERGSDLCVLNLNLCAEGGNKKFFPKSPTTGIAAAGGSALFAQMNAARAGFSIATIDGEVLAIGGFNRRGCLSSSERYIFSRNVWEERTHMDLRRARFAVVQSAGIAYAIGGCDGKQELGSVEAFDRKVQLWRKLRSSMITPRSSFGAAELDGKIYAIGGSHYSTPIRTAEVFDPSSEKWKGIPSMSTARSELAVASCNGRIYAIGGQKFGWKILSAVESYNPADKRWTKEACLNTPRRNAAVVTIEDRIFVIGGYDGSKPLDSVEVFDPLTGEWTYTTSMSVKRSHATAVVLDGSIYVVGGYSGSVFLNSVECFDPEEQQWSSFV